MAAQGFRPAAPRLFRLCMEDYLWSFPSKPSQFGMTAKGKAELIQLLCEALEVTPQELSLACEQDPLAVVGYSAGIAFLDAVECSIRSAQPVRGTSADIAFVIWLLKDIPEHPVRA